MSDEDPKHPRRRRRRVLETIFLILGLAGVMVWAGSQAAEAIWQDWGGWILDREVAGKSVSVPEYLADRGDQLKLRVKQWIGLAPSRAVTTTDRPAPLHPVTPHGVPLIGPDGLIGRVTIPRLDLSAIVREGTTSKTLSIAAGHIPGTALPGLSGNTAIAGHRDTLFRGLKDIKNGDTIDFETLQGRFEYQVESTEIVTPKDVQVLNPGPEPELTMVTCYPFYYVGNAPKRFIVKARLTSRGEQEPGVMQEVALEARQPQPKPPQAPVDRGHDPQQTGDSPKIAGPRKIPFNIALHHSRQVSPALTVGITDADAQAGGVYGWLWLASDRRTIWLRDRGLQDPLIFSTGPEGDRAELTITNIGEESVSGYVMLPQPK